jgi:hypothetical protein
MRGIFFFVELELLDMFNFEKVIWRVLAKMINQVQAYAEDLQGSYKVCEKSHWECLWFAKAPVISRAVGGTFSLNQAKSITNLIEIQACGSSDWIRSMDTVEGRTLASSEDKYRRVCRKLIHYHTYRTKPHLIKSKHLLVRDMRGNK